MSESTIVVPEANPKSGGRPSAHHRLPATVQGPRRLAATVQLAANPSRQPRVRTGSNGRATRPGPWPSIGSAMRRPSLRGALATKQPRGCRCAAP